MGGLAPIVMFVFSRPDHTRRTLEALAGNVLAGESDLIVYADAARNEDEVGRVRTVREIVRAAKGFKTLTVNERDTNYGLARNISEGVTEVCRHYGRVIVLEDDIVTSPYFLRFMNDGLETYAEDRQVWHISGWNYPIDPSGLGQAFFWRAMNCWGWATWADRWRHFEKDPRRLVRNWGREEIDRFNLCGDHDFWSQVLDNYRGKIDTWAIFWYATIFERRGVCLNPSCSLVANIGHDGSGENCESGDPYLSNIHSSEITEFPRSVEESKVAVERIRAFCRSLQRPGWKRAVRRLQNSLTKVRCDG